MHAVAHVKLYQALFSAATVQAKAIFTIGNSPGSKFLKDDERGDGTAVTLKDFRQVDRGF